MSRRRRSWWAGITPAGLLTTVTSCLCSLALVGTGCYLLVTGDVEGGTVALGLGGFSAQGTTSLLARTRPDPAATIEAPADVTARSADEPAA